MSIKVMKKALEVMHYLEALNKDTQLQKVQTIAELKQAISEAESTVQEPVAWHVVSDGRIHKIVSNLKEASDYAEALNTRYSGFVKNARIRSLIYGDTTPPAAQPEIIPLTEKELIEIFDEARHGSLSRFGFMRGIKAVLKAVAAQPTPSQEQKQDEIFCGVDFTGGVLSVSVLRRRPDSIAELLHSEQIELPAPLAHTTQQTPIVVPNFIRRHLEREIDMVTNPKGMSVHDGRTRALAADIAYLLKVIDTQPDTQSAQQEWVGLTDAEWMNIVNKNQAWFGYSPDEVAHEVAKLVEARLKEKNTKKV
jgi:hypothetical protein